MHIGSYLAEARKKNGLTIKDVATMAQLTPSLISQIENDKVNPSVNTALSLIRVLGLDPGEVFDNVMKEEDNSSELVRGDDNKMVRSVPNADYHLLANKDFENIEFVRTVLKKGYNSVHDVQSKRRHNYSGYEFCFLISGKIQITIDDNHYILTPNDSMCYAAEKSHSIMNLYNGDSVAVWLNIKRTIDEHSGVFSNHQDNQTI